MTEAITTSVEQLAERLTGSSRDHFSELVEGIRQERLRLKSGPYLIVIWTKHLDHQGLENQIALNHSFSDVKLAREFTAHVLNTLKVVRLRIPGSPDPRITGS